MNFIQTYGINGAPIIFISNFFYGLLMHSCASIVYFVQRIKVKVVMETRQFSALRILISRVDRHTTFANSDDICDNATRRHNGPSAGRTRQVLPDGRRESAKRSRERATSFYLRIFPRCRFARHLARVKRLAQRLYAGARAVCITSCSETRGTMSGSPENPTARISRTIRHAVP